MITLVYPPRPPPPPMNKGFSFIESASDKSNTAPGTFFLSLLFYPIFLSFAFIPYPHHWRVLVLLHASFCPLLPTYSPFLLIWLRYTLTPTVLQKRRNTTLRYYLMWQEKKLTLSLSLPISPRLTKRCYNNTETHTKCDKHSSRVGLKGVAQQ